MTKHRNSKYDKIKKKKTWDVIKLKNSECDSTPKLKYDKTEKLKIWQKKPSKCDKTENLTMWQSSKTQNLKKHNNSNKTKLKKLKFDKTIKKIIKKTLKKTLKKIVTKSISLNCELLIYS